MNVAKESAYAKINLYLDILKKRDDGFHDIRTVMHSVSLCDDIKITVSRSNKLSIFLSIKGGFLPTDDKNLAVRAAKLFFERAGKCATVNIELNKKIPISAGLAGGSSDAAAVLRALNKIYKRPFTQKALMAIGAEIGSDVPYCIIGKTALCEGRGEIITPIKTDIKLCIVLVSSGENVSTPEAYSELDAIYSDFICYNRSESDARYEKMMSGLYCGDLNPGGMFNIFEGAVLPKCQRASSAKARLVELGADAVMMSGSGATVFGVFKNEKCAEKAEQSLKAEGYKAWKVFSI